MLVFFYYFDIFSIFYVYLKFLIVKKNIGHFAFTNLNKDLNMMLEENVSKGIRQ